MKIFFFIVLATLAALTLRRQSRILKNQEEIARRLNRIMANQEEFDAQVAALNTKLDGISTQIAAEAQQIRDFITANPGIDTSALDGVATRLDGLNIGGIFEPPTEETPTE